MRVQVLRIGVIQGGILVEERVIAGRGSTSSTSVTIGPSPGATLVVPASPGVPPRAALFERGPRGTDLLLDHVRSGRIAIAGGASAVEVAGPRHRGGMGEHRVRLGEGARGRIEVGEVSVLFQLTHGVVAPKPRLPSSVRNTLLDRVDGAMIAIVAVSVLAHAGFVGYLRTLDGPRAPDIRFLPTRSAEFHERWRPSEPKVAIAQAPTGPGSAPTGSGPPLPSGQRKPAGAPRSSNLTDEVRRIGILRMLTARDEDGHGALDTLGLGRSSESADRAFAGLDSVTVGAAGGGASLGPRSSGGGAVRGIEGLRARGPDEVESDARGDEAVAVLRGLVRTGPIDPADPADPSQELDVTGLASTIRRSQRALSACYERELKENPGLAGKVALRVDIARSGRASGITVESDSARSERLNACLTRTLRGLVFPPPKEDVQFVLPLIFQPVR